MKIDNLCIICKNELIPSEEHIIPDSLLFNPDKEIITYNVCKCCNTKFGHTVDDEFLNKDLIKLLRFAYKDFMKKAKIPTSIKKNKVSTINFNGANIDLSIEIDINGIYYKSSKFENEGKKYIFIKSNESIKNIERLKKNNIIPIIIKTDKTAGGLLYEHLMNGFPVPFTRIFLKMAIEYISFKYGKAIVFDKKFDIIRNLIFYETNEYESIINLERRFIVDGKEGVEYVTHEIGIMFNENLNKWFFYFLMYNTLKFYVSIPADDCYRNESDVIKNYKININLNKKNK